MDKNLDSIVKQLTKQITRSEEVIERYKDQLAKDPAYALDSCDSLFEEAATLNVYRGVVRAIVADDSKVTLESLTKYVAKQVHDGARGGSSSTSQTANLMSRCKLQAWARLAEKIEWEG